MHKMRALQGLGLLIVITLIEITNGQGPRGPPPSGYYGRGPPPPSGLSSHYHHGPPPPPGAKHYSQSPYKISKPTPGSSKLVSWLNSQMSKLPRMPSFSKQPKKPKYPHPPSSHHHGPPPHAASAANAYHSSVIFQGPPTSSPFGSSSSFSSGPPSYFPSTTANEIYSGASVNDFNIPEGYSLKPFDIPDGYKEFTMPSGFSPGTSGPKVYQVIKNSELYSRPQVSSSYGHGPEISSSYAHGPSSHYSEGSSGASGALPPGYDFKMFEKQVMKGHSSDPNVEHIHEHVAPIYMHAGEQPSSQAGHHHHGHAQEEENVQHVQYSSGPAAPPSPTSVEGHAGGHSEIHYQRVPAQRTYSPAPNGFFKSQSSGNMEVLPSKMVSYEKETISTGHPEYNAALSGMSTSASHNINSYPFAFTQAPYKPQVQETQKVDENLNALFSGVAPQVAPLYDLSSLDGINGQQQQHAAASSQQQTYAQVPETVSLDALLSSFGGQIQGHGQSEGQSQKNSLSQLYGDTQAEYSHQNAVVVQPPSGFQYNPQPEQNQVQNQIQNQGQQQMQFQYQNADQSVGESQNKGVQILSHGTEDGQSIFQVIADANAPTFEGGHPFDINQLIAMIEPGAHVDPKDIVSEAGSENHETYANPQGGEGQGQIHSQVQIQGLGDSNSENNGGASYTVIQQEQTNRR